MASNYDLYSTGLTQGTLLNSRFEIIEKIGQGGFGQVYSAHDNENRGEKCAVKMIESLVFSNEDLVSKIKEIEFLIKSESKYILKYIGHFVYEKRPCIVTYFYKDGDLDQFIQKRKEKNKKIETIDILFWSKQILKGIYYLHRNGIMHRDLKPGNIFIYGTSLVIGDLGLAKSIKDLKSSRKLIGTLFYASPEVIKEQNYNFECDIWSFGCILYELVVFEKAFYGGNMFQIFKAVIENPIPQLSQPFLNSILNKCLQRKPEKRENANKLIEIIKEGNNNIEGNLSNVNLNYNDLDSIDKEVISLNKICRVIEEGNQSDIDIMKVNYERIKQLRGTIVINESKAKIDYIELLEKLACYEKKQLLNYNETLLIQKEILELKKKVYPKNDRKIADTLINVGLAYLDLGEYNDAIKYYEEALEIKLKSLPKNDSAIAEIQNNLGNAYFHLNNLTKSMKLLKQAMDIYEGLSENSLGYANTLHNFAKVQHHLGEYIKAKEFFEKALEMKRKTLPENHESIADTLYNLGWEYDALGDKNRAIEFYERALEMFRKTLPEKHKSIANTLNNLGNAYDDLGDKSKAKDFYEKALEMKRKTLPENHSSISNILNNIGIVYKDLGDKNKAKEFYEEALKMKRKTLPENHESIANILNNLGNVYKDLGDKKKAKEFYENALEMYRKTLPENHPSIATTLNNLGRLYSDLGDKNKAKEFYGKALEMFKKTLPESHKSIATTLTNLGNVYSALGDKNKAKDFYEKAFEMKRKTLPENHPSIKRTLTNLNMSTF